MSRDEHFGNGLPIYVIMPSLLIALIMIAVAFVGDGLRDALDPQMSR